MVQCKVLFAMHVYTQGGENRHADKCDNKATTYIVTLQNNFNASVEREIDLDSCEDSICSTDIPISDPNGTYSVSVSAISILGTNSVMFQSMIRKLVLSSMIMKKLIGHLS